MCRFGTLVLVGLALQSAASAAFVGFDNFGPENSYGFSGYTIAYGSSAGNQFATSVTGNLSEIDLAMGHLFGARDVTVQLLTDSNNAPGSVLESFQLTVTNDFSSPGSFIPVFSTTHPLLSVGAEYWLLASATNSGSADVWYINSTNGYGMRYTDGAVTGDWMATFRVSVTHNPEPATFVLAGAALCLIGRFARRRA